SACAGGRTSYRPIGIIGPATMQNPLQFKNGNGGLRSCGANYLRTRDKKRLDVLAARHLRMRRHEAVARFALPDQRARQRERVLQPRRPAQRNVEKGIAEIGPFGAILAAEGRMIGVGRRDYQAIRVGEPWYEHAGIAGRYDYCPISHVRRVEHVGKVRWRERFLPPSGNDGEAIGRPMRRENEKENVIGVIHILSSGPPGRGKRGGSRNAFLFGGVIVGGALEVPLA